MEAASASAGPSASSSGAPSAAARATNSSSSAARKRDASSSSKPVSGGGTSVSMKAQGNDAGPVEPALATGDHFARNVALMSVAHVARSVGFDAVQRSAGDALAEILAKYIQRIGGSAKEIAELAGRTQPRATDVMQALNGLVPVPVDVKDLISALETAKRPFPRDVPTFPARKRDFSGNSIDQTKIGQRDSLPAHVPSFLPPLPNRHAYSSDSRVVVERDQDTKRTRLDLLSQKSQVQQSLHGLQTVFAKKPAPIVHQPTWNAFQGATGENATENPFLQPPVVLGASVATAGIVGAKMQQQSVFSGPERAIVPTLSSQKAGKKHHLDSNTVSIPKLASNQDLGKEEKILTGTFHDGDSE